MSKKQCVCVLGGTGFVGRHIIALLAKNKQKVKVLTRNRERHRDLLVMPSVELIDADIHDAGVLKKEFNGCDAVINLVGILHDEKKSSRSFRGVHVELARKVLDACRATNVTRLLHMSAIKADAGRGSSHYLRSKGEAENLVHTNKHIHVTSFRPSVIFGLEDNFLNRFAQLLKLTPKFMPFPLACPNTKFAPIYVEDVANAFVKALDNKATYDQHYDLCGPKTYTLKQLVKYTGELTGNKRLIIGLGNGLSKLQSIILELMPGKPFTYDNFLSLKQDAVCDKPFPQVFNIKPSALETVAPLYLANRQIRGRFSQFRQHARRDV
ncbi:complex I NDUFA9 subunit family protein [Kaarinaea lacus]